MKHLKHIPLALALCGVPTLSFAVTINVDTTVDKFSDSLTAQHNCLGKFSPACSLREAVQVANDLPGADTIVLGEGTYKLTKHGQYENYNAKGDLDIKGTLTITGVSPEKTIIDGDKADRILHHHKGDLTVNKLTLQNGFVENTPSKKLVAAGAALLSNNVGKVKLSQVWIKDNITNNTVASYCTNKEVPEDTWIGYGNSVFYRGAQLTMQRSTIVNQQFTCQGLPAYYYLSGIGNALYAEVDQLTLSSVVIANNKNTSTNIYITRTVHLDCFGKSTCSHTLSNVTLYNNSKHNLFFSGSLEKLGEATIDINKLSSRDGSVRIAASSDDEKINPKANIHIRNSSFDQTYCGLEVWIYEIGDFDNKSYISVDGLIEHSTFSNNEKCGIEIKQKHKNYNTWQIRNNTISGNDFMGFSIFEANATLIYNTIAFNEINILSGGSFEGTNQINLLANILSNAKEDGGNCIGFDVFTYESKFISLGYNIDDDNTCMPDNLAIGDIIYQDPLLGPLTNNGGYNKTHAPKIGSPAINAANVTQAQTGTASDQRYKLRNDGIPDIGAVEFKIDPLPCDPTYCGDPEK